MNAYGSEVFDQPFGEIAVGFEFGFGQDYGLTRKSMREAVEGGLLFSSGAGRAGGVLCILTICVDLLLVAIGSLLPSK